MALRNRVTPLGDIVADPARGLVYGNRGCLHDASGRIRRRYAGKRWISCRLVFRDWHRHPLLQPGRFTELFFLDEATAFAAGHRPCALCRRDDYDRFTTLWQKRHPTQIGADAMDAQLQLERIEPLTHAQLRHDAAIDALPDGAFVLQDDAPWLVRGEELLRWSPGCYGEGIARPRDRRVVLITPPSLVDVLRAGWISSVPLLHPSAG